MIPVKNKRRNRRIPYLGPVRISWETEGAPCFTAGRCIDISDDGMRIEVSQMVPRGRMIQVAVERLKASGSATVRRSDRLGGRIVLGLQFNHDLLANVVAGFESGAAE